MTMPKESRGLKKRKKSVTTGSKGFLTHIKKSSKTDGREGMMHRKKQGGGGGFGEGGTNTGGERAGCGEEGGQAGLISLRVGGVP